MQAEFGRLLYGGWDMDIGGRLEWVTTDERSGVDPDEDLDLSYPVITARLSFRNDSSYPRFGPTE